MVRDYRELDIYKITLTVALVLLATTMMGCSVTSLQCGVDGDSSFINLNTTPKVLSQNMRNMAQLCAFAYEVLENETP